MRFHIRRAIAYGAALFLVFLLFLSFTSNEFTGFEQENPGFIVSRNRRISEEDSGKWIIKATYPNRTTLSHHDEKPVARVKVSPASELPLVVYHPGSKASAHLWPHSGGDRIQAQIKHVPHGYSKKDSKLKHIYVPAGLGETPEGQEKFISEECLIDACFLTTDKDEATTAHAVLLQGGGIPETDIKKQPGQIWILWLLESPLNTMDFDTVRERVNWTATFRRDSTIVTPYEKFVPFPNATSVMSQPKPNYAKGKSKMAAWFVSNCGARNQRWELVKELQEYISVDIYGACGSHTCYRHEKDKCDQILNTEYKFYLSFENSNCIDYITEKFYWNALWNDIVPVVLGARKEDYASVSPPNSFIHIEDFDSVADLANYLLKLDQNEHMYNQYFQWKHSGTFINTKFWCRMCSMLHTADHDGTVTWYRDLEEWWRSPGVCTQARWDDKTAVIEDWEKYSRGEQPL